jgi:hypothetical protein
MKEIDFDPATMTRATAADIFRMWKLLWGDKIITRGGLELVPAWRHKPNDVGSIPTLAPNENRKSDVRIAEVPDAVETESERNEGLRKGNAEADRGRDE